MKRLQVGQGMVEYVFILLMVAIGLIVAFMFVGNSIVNTLVGNIIGYL